MSTLKMSADAFAAIDVHVHLEPVVDNPVDAAAKKYFGESGAPRERKGLADYYRSRKIAFVIFAVDERLTGKPRVSNEEVIQFANENWVSSTVTFPIRLEMYFKCAGSIMQSLRFNTLTPSARTASQESIDPAEPQITSTPPPSDVHFSRVSSWTLEYPNPRNTLGIRGDACF